MTRLRTYWPELRRVPAAIEAARYARDVRVLALGIEAVDRPLYDLSGVLRLGGLEVFETRLSAQEGMQEAMLVPLSADAFAISVDPTPRGGWRHVRPAIRETLRRHRIRFRVAHEIAHTFFYSRTIGEPRRLVRDSPAQEAFCDEFARALLLPPSAAAASSLTASAVFDLHRGFDVSLEVAARSMAAAHGSNAAVALWYQLDGGRLKLQWASPGARRAPACPALLDYGREPDRDAKWDDARGQWLLTGARARASVRSSHAERDDGSVAIRPLRRAISSYRRLSAS
jgi:hypothetical protein